MRNSGLVIVMAALAVALPAVVGSHLAATQATPPTPFAIGATVPGDIALKDINGAMHTLGEFRGKVVFIHFWSIVCPYEKLAEPKCIELQKAYADKGLVEIAINANQKEIAAGGDTFTNLREHVQQAGVNFLVTVDPGNKVTDLFGGQSTPHCFVIDREGVLRYSGALDDDPKGTKGASAVQYVRDAIDAVLAGKPVGVDTTKPYG